MLHKKTTETEKKISVITNLVMKTSVYENITEIENETSNTTGLATANVLNTKAGEKLICWFYCFS